MPIAITEISDEKLNPLEAFKQVEYPEVDCEHFGDTRPDFQEYKFTLLAEEDTNIVGYINITVRLGIAYIDSLLVGKAHRNKGIGKSLVLRAEEKAKTYNAHKIWLETGANWGTEKFYKDLGYSIRCRVSNDVAHIEAISMDKMLDESIVNTGARNIAFIDSQNLNLGIQNLGWKMDYKKFRIYLKEKYNIKKAYMFIGFVALNQKLYDSLQEAGFILKFKPTIPDANGKLKGNVDTDLVLQAMLEWNDFDKALIVTSDGDFYSLVDHLYRESKLEAVLSSEHKACSSLLRQTGKDKIRYMDNLRKKLEYKKSTA